LAGGWVRTRHNGLLSENVAGVGVDAVERGVDDLPLSRRAAEEGHLFAVSNEPRVPEPKVAFEPLLMRRKLRDESQGRRVSCVVCV
jgi:hypothetical protein